MKNKFFLAMSIGALTIPSVMDASFTLYVTDNEVTIDNKTYTVATEDIRGVWQYGLNGPHAPQITLTDREGQQIQAQLVPIDWIYDEDNLKHNNEWLRLNAIPKIPADALEYKSKVYSGLSYLVLENK